MSVKVFPVLLYFVALILSSSASADSICEPDDYDPAPRCYHAFDVVQIQSIVSSSTSRWSTMIREARNLTKFVEELGTESHLGFATFGDKNISGIHPKTNDYYTLGSETDRCFDVDLPLARPDTEKMVKLFEEFQKKEAAGRRGDWFDGVFEGVYRGLLAPTMKWRPNKTLDGKNVKRVVFVVVDTGSHIEGDILQLTGKTLPPFNVTEKDLEGTENYNCDKVDYPSLKQLADLVNRLRATLVMVVSPGGFKDSRGNFAPFEDLERLGRSYDGKDGLKRWYDHRLRQAKVTTFHVWEMDPDLKSIGESYEWFTKHFQDMLCK